MGLLDDAIREHLELKRRRGADPTEVEKQEREALGPVRGAAPVEEAEAPNGDEPVLDEPDAPEFDIEPEEELEGEHLPPRGETIGQPTEQFSVEDLHDELHSAAPPRREDPPSSVLYDDEADAREEPGPEPPRSAAPVHEDEEDDLFPPASRPRDDEVVAADEEPEGDDVLDETPEFLQEAPEHDRLWFEQKPPRDFDF